MKPQKLFDSGHSMEILVYLFGNNEKSVTEISQGNKITYSYLLNLIKWLEELNLVKAEKKGRKSIITLTEKGKEVAQKLFEVKEILEEKQYNPIPQSL